MRTDTATSAGIALRAYSGVARLTAESTMLRERVLPLALIVTAAFFVRVVWVAFSEWQPIPGDDAYRYDFAARALAEGRGYIHLNGAPSAFWPPGYPLLLAGVYALFGPSVGAAQAVNVILGTGTVVVVYLIGERTLGRRPALIGAGIVALFPSLIFFTAVTLSEVAFTFLALLGVYLLIVEAQSERERDLRLLLGAGLVIGFASLVRGQALLLPLVLVPFWLRSGVEWRGVADKVVALALGIGLIVAPWTVRNAIELEAPVLIATNAGVDFWIGHNDDAAGDFGVAGGEELVLRHPELTTTAREVRVNSEGFREGLAYAVTHPVEESFLAVKKFVWLYYNDEEGLKWNEGHGGQPFLSGGARETLLTLSNVYYFAVLALLVAGTRHWLTKQDPGKLLLTSLLAYWTLIHLAFFGDPRFHAPIMPVVALLAAPALAAVWAGRAPWARAPGGSAN